MSVRHLEALFAPRSVAVVGVSAQAGDLGACVLRNLRQAGWRDPLWLVDARGGDVDGLRIHADVAALPQAPELAVVCTPAAAVPQVIAALAQRGTRAALVLAAGLRQPGPDGATPGQAMLEAARPALLRIVGADSIGVLVPRHRLNASVAPVPALPGAAAFVAQTGALATAVLDAATAHGIGFSHFVSLGDSLDVDCADVIDYLASDAGTRAILLYLESLADGRKFMAAARAAARNKPVIVVKAARDRAGAGVADSRLRALAAPEAVFDAAVRRAGLLRVPTLEALFDAAATLAHPPPWQGDRLAVLTNAAGAGVLAADALARAGGRLAALEAGTVQALDASLPAHSPCANPVRIAGDAPADHYLRTLRTLLAAPEVDGVLFMHAPTAVVPASDIAQACLPLAQGRDKPVLACWLGRASVQRARRLFADAGVPCYATPEQGVTAWLQLADYHRHQQLLMEMPEAAGVPPDAGRERAAAVLQEALCAGREWLDETRALEVLRAYGIPTAGPAPAMPQGQAGPTDVQATARAAGALRLVAGVVDDPAFGPVLLFGDADAPGDSTLELPPLNARLAHAMLVRTRVGSMPVEADPAVNPPALVDTLLRLSQLACEQPALAELALDPLLADVRGVRALAARIRVRPTQSAGGRLALRPYPSALQEKVTLADQEIVVRPVLPDDARGLLALYAQVRPSTLRLRFFLARREVPLGELARYCQIDYDREMAFVALAGGGIVGEVRAVCDPGNERAEFALHVAPQWQRRGLGHLLLHKMLAYLRARGTREAAGMCPRDNAGMAALARRFGFAQHDPGGDALLLRLPLDGSVPPAPATS